MQDTVLFIDFEDKDVDILRGDRILSANTCETNQKDVNYFNSGNKNRPNIATYRK